jgi:hypothetical protein
MGRAGRTADLIVDAMSSQHGSGWDRRCLQRVESAGLTMRARDSDGCEGGKVDRKAPPSSRHNFAPLDDESTCYNASGAMA